MTATTDKPGGIVFDLGSTIFVGERLDIRAGGLAILESASNHKTVDAEEFLRFADELNEVFWELRDQSALDFRRISYIRILGDWFGLSYTLPLEQIELEFW